MLREWYVKKKKEEEEEERKKKKKERKKKENAILFVKILQTIRSCNNNMTITYKKNKYSQATIVLFLTNNLIN